MAAGLPLQLVVELRVTFVRGRCQRESGEELLREDVVEKVGQAADWRIPVPGSRSRREIHRSAISD
jgi:hypothetical protein